MGLSTQSLAKLLFQHFCSVPRRTLKDTSLHCAHFRLLGILVGAETGEVEGSGIKLLLPDSARNHRFFPRF